VKPQQSAKSQLQIRDQVVASLDMDQFMKHYRFQLFVVERIRD